MTPEKILKVSAGEKKVIEEILVEGDVGDFLDDVLEEESDKIFSDNNPSSFQSEIDWESPPKYDEYRDDEYDICELIIVDGAHVAIQETGRIALPKENASEASPLSISAASLMDIPILGIKCNQEQGDKECAFDCIPVKELNTLKEPSSVFASGSWVFPSSDIPPFIRCDKPDVINGFSFQDGNVTEDGVQN
ncbi:hypothetical protein RHGRI_017902 [Rhododendron griersonianum]|uniref:Uncharacterized protein n=1 Tax=Rhododendron griersonianum TaxID=479676 RepID=A0AAV6JZG1_9ERIC|nr:hypothetical protein RHGRI_017902 [Rhododendron griersonianum]